MSTQPQALEEIGGSRILTIEADVVALEKMRKEGRSGGFTVYCDEGPRVGGEGSAPPPLRYLGLAVGF